MPFPTIAAASLLLALAQSPAPSAPPSPGAACVSAAHRRFDFWIGEWESWEIAFDGLYTPRGR